MVLCIEEKEEVLAIIKEKGINKVMITCRKANIASARIIEQNGGVYDDDYVLDDNTVYKRYWIKLK